MKRRLLPLFLAAYTSLAPALRADEPAPNSGSASQQTSSTDTATNTDSTTNPMPDEYPYNKDCFKCGEKVDSDDSNKSCPEGTSENPEVQSLYYTVGLGTTSYNTKNNYVSRDLGLRQKEFSTYNGPRVDQPPFNGSLTSEWGEKLMRPVVIGLVTETITPATFTPASLQLQGENAGNAWVKRDAANALRQILSDQYLTNIIAENNGTTITSYLRSTIGTLNATTGLYNIPATARKFRTVTITRPDQNSLTTCDITTTDYSSSLTSPKVRIRRWVTNASFTNWTLSHFADTTQPNKEYSRLVLEKTDLGNGILQRTRTHSELTADASLLVTKITREKYRDLGQGNLRIMETTNAPGTPEESTTTYTYTDSTGSGTIGLNGTITAPAANGSPNQLTGYRIASVQHSSGSWTQYQYTYNGATKIMVTDQWTPWKNAAFGDKTNAIRTTIILEESGRTVTQRIGTQIISDLKETLSTLPDGTRVIRSSTSTGTTTTPLINETGYFAENAAEPNRGRIRYSRHNDGTLTSYSYTTQGSNIKTTTHNGVINAAQSAANATGPISGTFTAGTRSETITNAFNREIAQASYDIASNLLLNQWDAITFDDVGRPTKIIHNLDPNDYEETTYNCCGIATRRERDGTTTQFTRDFLGRETFTTSVTGSRTTNTATTFGSETINGRNLPKTTRTRSVTSAGNTMSQFLGESIENLAGQTILSRSPDANGDGQPEETTYTHNIATRTTTSTGPDGTISTSTRYADGQQHTSVTTANIGGSATAITPLTTYDYTLHNLNGGGIKTTVTQFDDNVVLKSSSSYADLAGRTIKTESPGYNGAILTSTPLYDERGRNIGATSTGQPSMKYVLNLQGETTEVWTDANGDGEFNDTVVADIKDTCQKTTTDYVTEDGKVCQRSTQSLRTDANADVITATSYTSTDGLYRKTVPLAGTGPITTTTATRPNVAEASSLLAQSTTKTYLTATTFLESTTTTTLNANGTTTTTQTNKDTTGATITTASSTNDIIGRTVSETGERGLTTTYSNFTEAGQPLLTTHSDGTKTRITLDAAARPTKVETLDATGAVKATRFTSYHSSGQVAAEWGDLTYPTYKLYNIQGQMEELRTFKNIPAAQLNSPTLNLAAQSGYEKTNWNYEPATGLLLSKRYADEKGPGYTYTADGKMHMADASRLLANSTIRLNKTHNYNAAGQLTGIDYNDTTPDVTITYNRLGQKKTVTNTISSTVYAYDPATLALDTETITHTLPGAAPFTRIIDRSQDPLGRSTGFQVLNGATFESGAKYDYNPDNARLASVSSLSSASLVSDVFSYNYITNSSLIHTVTGPKHTVTNTYDPDRSGGILLTKANTRNSNQSAISSVNYIVNTLGQREERTTTDAANNSATTEWTYDALGQVETEDQPGTTTDRAYQYDTIGNRKKSANSLTLPATDNYTSNALNQYTSITSGQLTSEPQYDFDGNMTHGPHPADPTIPTLFFYDAENRLLEIRNATTGVTLQCNHYDAFHRLIRVTALHNGQSTTEHILWKDWSLLSRFVSNGNSLSEIFHYTWGKDLSGSEQGAGGVGGLLAITRIPATGEGSTRYPLYDGNGNITALVTANGSLSATYQYDAFGNTLSATDNDASGWVNHNIHGFSTKPTFGHQGLHYYGYRWYTAKDGRWINRDPIAERGGVNLYGFVGNDGLRKIDVLGWAPTIGDIAGRILEDAGSLVGRIKGGDWLGQALLHHYRFGSGDTFSLTYAESKDIYSGIDPISITNHPDYNGALKRSCISKTWEDLNEYEYPVGGVKGNADLFFGNFFIAVKGKLCGCYGTWTFVGHLQIRDTFDFDIHWIQWLTNDDYKRSFAGEARTTIAALMLVNGDDFNIESPWFLSLEKSGDGEIRW